MDLLSEKNKGGKLASEEELNRLIQSLRFEMDQKLTGLQKELDKLR